MIFWVTGGGTGIGRALAEALYCEGHRVILSGRRAEVLSEAAQAIGSRPSSGEVLALPGDVTHPEYRQAVVHAVRERWGEIEGLINNAGVLPPHPLEEAPVEEFEEVFRINCLAAIACAKAVLPAMRTRRQGMIVNISSILGKWASADSPAYSVSKYALAGFNDSLRQSLAGTGIHVMGVYPGYILTPMTAPFGQETFWRTHWGKTPEALTRVILHGMRKKKREIFYPWYVPLALRLHAAFPGSVERLRRTFGR